MDKDTPLWKAHDISQQLQDKIEVLPNVERAFVHVDHETTHIPVSSLESSLMYDAKLSVSRSIARLYDRNEELVKKSMYNNVNYFWFSRS
jgi:hypothetical protein